MDNLRPLFKSSQRGFARRPFHQVLVFMLALSGPGCDGGEGASFAIKLVGAPQPEAGACPALLAPAPPIFEESPPDLMRLTYREAGGGPLVCDAVLPLDGENRVVALPGQTDLVDVYVELFRGDAAGAELRASGVARAVDPRSGRTAEVQIRQRETFACAPEPATAWRAFHTATRLPGGQVLLVGGLVGDPEGGTGRVDLDAEEPLYTTDKVELFEPRSAEFRQLSVPGLRARAMHQAVLLGPDGAGRLKVALLGGLTVRGDPSLVPAARFGGEAGALRILPGAEALPAPPELLAIDLETFAAERLEVSGGPASRFFAAAGGSPRPVFAGGMSEEATDLSFDLFDPESGTALSTFPLQAARVGATATDLGAGRLLLYGGNLSSDGASAEAAEVVSGLEEGGAPASTLLTASGASDPAIARAFHAAAPTGDGGLLLAGGFAPGGGSATSPAAPFAQRFDDGAPPSLTDVVVLGGQGVPAGYLEATPLADGDVLVSGGNPALGHQSCPQDAGGLVCAVGNAYRYRLEEGSLDPVGSLVIPRYGHRMTPLPDGTVLVTGGLAAGTGGFRVLADAEIFEPRSEADDPIADLELVREPGDVARDDAGEPIAECRTVR